MVWSEEMRIMEGTIFKAMIQDSQVPNLRREPKVTSLGLSAKNLGSTSSTLPSKPQAQQTDQLNPQVGERTTTSAALIIPIGPIKSMSWGDRSPYSYHELNPGEIRLFCLFPDVTRNDIRGMILSIPFQEAVAYHAVSYVWGDPEQPKVEILTPNGVLSVHESIHQALGRLRKQDEPVILWADAICINQKNNQEKANQLQLLPCIFQSAASTLAILGQDQKSETAIEEIAELNKRVNARGLILDCSPDEATDWHDSTLQHLYTIFSHPWFERAWIVQEAVASPSVTLICGKYAVDWDGLFVLHASQEREGLYRLLGECYISDIMYGELFDTDRSDNEVFTIY
ncbi:unnamed protein product [Clonostachys rosea]|uniref:Heterokaryon incompatibility domain-containing protein n=1 Tax=Bionectria ochroleuca TaxID=29856 RepID=A0ABY6UC09_BIOOC|nr:unnamed protein product [Clonostachys rosea]